MHLSDMLGIFSNHYIWRNFWFLVIYRIFSFDCYLLFKLFSIGLQNVQILYSLCYVIHYTLRFRYRWTCQNCFHCILFNTGIYRKVTFNGLLLFSYFSVSINCRSWACRLHNIFLSYSESEVISMFKGF